MPDTPITSNQIVRTADIACVPVREVVAAVLADVPFGGDVLQRKIIEDGGTLQSMLRPELEQLLRRTILQLAGVRHPAADDMERYFKEVFAVTIDLTGITFPEKAGMPAAMVNPRTMNADEILKRLTAYFKVNPYVWKSPVVSNIDTTLEQPRPVGMYVYRHVGSDEPDKQHLNTSYDDATAAKMLFHNHEEYLYSTGFHRWKYGHFMDRKGATRTSSVWSDGSLVMGSFNPGHRKLYLPHGDCDRRNPDRGPRELFLG